MDLLDAARRLGSRRGTFETHLTVAAEGVEAFAGACARLGVACVQIELARGAHPSQPMTASHHVGDLVGEVVPAVIALQGAIEAAGFPVIRVKVEVPADAGPDGEGGEGYFEMHAKLRLPVGGDRAALAAICAAHGAHLSRNARRTRGEVEERFATLRIHGAGRARAEVAFAAFERALAEGHDVIGAEREYALYDGRVELDAGWLP